MASSPDSHGAIQMVVVVPSNVVPGQQVTYNTPDGQQVIVVVPDGVAPGSSITVQYSAMQERARAAELSAQAVHQHVTVPTASPAQPVYQHVAVPLVLPAQPAHQQVVGPTVLSSQPVEPAEAERRPSKCRTCCKCIRGATLITGFCLMIIALPIIVLKSHLLHLHHWHPHAWHRHYAHGNQSNHSKHHGHLHRHHTHGNHAKHSNEADMIANGYYDEADMAYGYYSSEHQDHFHSATLRGMVDMKHAHHSFERQDVSDSSTHRYDKEMSHAAASRANAIEARAMIHSENEFKTKTRSDNDFKQPLADYGSDALNEAKNNMVQLDAEQIKNAGEGLKMSSNFEGQRPESVQNKVSSAVISERRARSNMPTVMI